MINHRGIFACLLLAMNSAIAQDTLPISETHIDQAFVNDINKKADRINQKLGFYTEKALKKARRLELNIAKKLEKTDSVSASRIRANTNQLYQELEQNVQGKSSPQEYIPSLDTISSSLKFLQQNPQWLSNHKEASQKLTGTLKKVGELNGGLAKAEEIKKLLHERKQYFKDQLGKLGLSKELKKLNKQAYYFSAQVNEYKSLLKDYSKAERKALKLLSKSKLFNNFMRKNSMLASLFNLPGDPGDPLPSPGIAGLQTRVQVNSLIQQQVTGGDPNAQQQFQQNLQQAQHKLAELKNKLINSGLGSSDAAMPEGFVPNNQKTKKFLQRFEWGVNFQSVKANGFFPVTSDIGISIGYKPNDRFIAGIGSSYKIGWGKNIRHIRVTQQGAGIRSFLDWKIKGSFWLSGGYEMNYKNEFQNIDELKNLQAWQRSGLIGLSKVVSLKTKFFKRTKVQVLFDFLSYQQVPKTQPVVFRIGYSF